MSVRANQCQYCCRFADDVRDVELRLDGETWKESYASRICGECRKHLYQSRQFRYVRQPRRKG